MSKEAPKPAAKDAKTAAPDAGAKKKSKLPLLIIAAVVLLGGGGGAFWFLRPHKDAAAAEAEKAAPVAKLPAIYYKFEPAFVVNFGSEGNARYLQITLEAMSRDPKTAEAIKGSEPAIRNDLVLLYSAQQYDTLVSAEGKEKLRAGTLEAVRKAVADEGGKPETVENVYFTSFVIQ
jgi:flagellar FliL protein